MQVQQGLDDSFSRVGDWSQVGDVLEALRMPLTSADILS